MFLICALYVLYKIALAIKIALPVHPFVKEHPPRKAGKNLVKGDI